MMRDISPQTNNVRQQVNPLALFESLQSRVPNSSAMIPIGLSQLQAHCSSIYPDQTALCLRPKKSFINDGGSDPLDYIYIYKNEGDPNHGIPKHWHYIGFGLSDIHNYGLLCYLDMVNRSQNPVFANTPPLQQLYPLPGSTKEKLSGFGFELSFRIKCNSSESWLQQPPQWPGQVLQALAKYVFQSKNVFSVGDHAAWHCSLDGDDESRIEHMLMTLDPQLKEVETALGTVRFIQLVGVCQEELQAAREWNVKGILDIMKERSETGGEFLVTDMRRGATIFELNPENRERVDNGITKMGSDMTLISAKHKYSSSKPKWFKDVENLHRSSEESQLDNQEKEPLMDNSERSTFNSMPGVERGSFLTMTRDDSHFEASQDFGIRNPSRMSHESESALLVENAELVDTRFYDNIYLLLNYESAKVLPVVLEGRLAHKRPFTYQSFKGDLWTTFVPEGATIESLVTREQPFARRGVWLQIYVSDELRQQMLGTIRAEFQERNNEEPMTLPRNYSWPDHKLYITVVDEVKEATDSS